MRNVRLLLMVVACLTVAGYAQEAAGEPITGDYAEGIAAGQVAATGKGGDGVAMGLAGGGCTSCCLGGVTPMATPVLLFPLGCGGGLLGGGVTHLLGAKGGRPEPAVEIGLSSKSDDYKRGFYEGYSNTFKANRTRNIWIGAGVGTAVSVAAWAAVIWLILPNYMP